MNPEEVGRLLRERREELDMDVADVQQATKIRAKYIRAIEQGDTEGLPAPVYAKGFVRAIANALGLDGFALMQEYLSPPADNERAPAEESPKEPAELERARRGRPLWVQSPAGPPVARPTQNRGFSAIILIVLVFVLLLGAGYAINYYWLSELNNPAPVPPEAENPTNNPPDESTPPQEPPAEEPSSATPDETVLSVETTRDETQNIITFGLKADDGTLPDQLEVSVTSSGRCWLRVTRETTGELLYEGTLSAGDEYTWTDPVGLRLRAGAPETLNLGLNTVDIGTPVSVGAWTFIFRFAD